MVFEFLRHFYVVSVIDRGRHESPATIIMNGIAMSTSFDRVSPSPGWNTRQICKILCLLTLCTSLSMSSMYLKREHSLTKPYQGSGMTIPNWDFAGTTIVTTQFIRLTPDEQSRQGALWNKVPLHLRNWEIHLEFKVSGKGHDLFGDGMAFWYVRDPLKIGSVFGNEDNFWGVGIFLDTYANQNGAHSHGHPYVSAMVNNGSLKYDHDRDGTHTELAGCEAKFRGVDHDTYLMVRYEGDRLSVSTDIEADGKWKECFSVDGVQLPTGYYIGVSAATGELSDNHDVISIKTYELEGPPSTEDRSFVIPSAAKHAPHRDHVNDPPSAGRSILKIFFYIFLTIIGVGVVIGIGFYFYQQKGVKKNRFY